MRFPNSDKTEILMTPAIRRRTVVALEETRRMLTKFESILAQEARSAFPSSSRIEAATWQVTFLTGHIAKLVGYLTQEVI